MQKKKKLIRIYLLVYFVISTGVNFLCFFYIEKNWYTVQWMESDIRSI